MSKQAVDRLLRSLKKYGPWTMTDFGEVEPLGEPGSCPYLAASMSGSRQLGLSDEEKVAIFAAADNNTLDDSYDPRLRARLLKACGLKEEK